MKIKLIDNVFVLALLVFMCSAPVTSAFADTDKSDLVVAMKTLPLLANKIVGMAKIAVIFDANNADSKQEATHIKNIIESGLEIPGDIKLVAILVPVTSLQDISGKQIAILTDGLSKYYDAINQLAINNHVLTMSTDLVCVHANKCILGIISQPKVEIYYSKQAADAAQVSFGPVFSMLVKQL